MLCENIATGGYSQRVIVAGLRSATHRLCGVFQ